MMKWLLLLLFPLLSSGDEIEDLISCCPYPASPCSIQHSCCIQLCSAKDSSLGVRGLSDTGTNDGCCPPSDPCGEKEESGNCMLCECDSYDDDDGLFFFDSLRSGFSDPNKNNTTSGLNGLERISGKGFEESTTRSKGLQLLSGLIFDTPEANDSESNNTLGLRSNLDFAFLNSINPEQEEGEEITYLRKCCPSSSEPCNVQHSCCIQLCSALSPGLGVRTALDVGSDGCCPESDPCGENLESGNCIHCNCNYDYYDTHPLDDTLRSGFSVGGDIAEYEDYGFERESGKSFDGLQVKVGFTENHLEGEDGLRFDRVHRESGPANTEDNEENTINGAFDKSSGKSKFSLPTFVECLFPLILLQVINRL